jgi:hypothetical protein
MKVSRLINCFMHEMNIIQSKAVLYVIACYLWILHLFVYQEIIVEQVKAFQFALML